ncbi:MAG: SH3 domain-containing protein [Crocinitomicaceae bacterium]
MKAFYLFIALLFCNFSFSSDSRKTEADSAYLAGDYSYSLKLYSQLLNEYPHSALLYFKLGNTYFKNNERGKAIWAYYRAKKLAPNHEDINYNLNYVLNLSEIEIESQIFDFSNRITKFLYGRGTNFWAYLTLIFTFIGTLFFYLFKTIKGKNKQRIFLVVSICSALVFIISFSLAILHYRYINTLDQGIIIENAVEVKTAPSDNETTRIELSEGMKFKLKEKQNDWFRIELGQGEGWIKKSSALLF